MTSTVDVTVSASLRSSSVPAVSPFLPRSSSVPLSALPRHAFSTPGFIPPSRKANIPDMRQVILRGDHEDGGWIAEVPSLPGCLSQGETKQEALANVRDAMISWISAAVGDARQVPPDPGDAEIVEIPEEI